MMTTHKEHAMHMEISPFYYSKTLHNFVTFSPSIVTGSCSDWTYITANHMCKISFRPKIL